MTKYDDKVKKNTFREALQSTIKVFVILMSLVFLLNFVSAEELLTFDNVKNYDVELQEVTIVNTFNIGRTIAKIRLDTPLIYQVPRGYQKVAQFTINSYDNSYTDALKEIKTYDYHNLKNELQRKLDYKLLTYENYEVNDYKEVCKEDLLSKNGTLSCEWIVSGTHIEQREKWIDFDSSVIYKGNYTIGIFTEVYPNDKVEWIPDFYGVKITKWAIWEESLNVELVSYWKFDETSGITAFDSLYLHNGTNSGATINQTGKIKTSYSYGGDGDVVDFGKNSAFDFGNNSFSISLWVYPTEAVGYLETLFAYTQNTSEGPFLITRNAIGYLQIYIANPAPWTIIDTELTIPTNAWSHIVVVRNETKVIGYRNGVSGINGTVGNASNDYATRTLKVGTYGNSGHFQGKIDEIALLNRSLSYDEVSDLYNSGDGITYRQGLLNPSLTLNFPIAYYNTSNPTITFEAEATDDFTITNVSLYLDGVINETNTSGVNGTYEFTKTLSEGNHNWSILAFNNNSLSNQSDTRELWINTIPLVTLDAPENYANLSYNNIHFNTTVYSVYDIANVSFYLNGNLNETNTDGTNGSYVFEKYLVDGYYNWSIVAMSSLGGYNQSATRILTVDYTNPLVSIVYPLNITYNTTLASEDNISIWFNWTVSDTNLHMCWWSNDSGATNNTISCNANSSEYWTYGQKSFIAWANDTAGNLGVARRTATWAYFSLVNATSYNDASYETKNETFYLNLTIGSMITKISPYLLYNGTYYAANSSCSGTLCQISRKIDIPLLTSNSLDSENKSFLWQVTTFGDFGTSNENTTSYIQNVSRISFTNSGCVANYNASVNFTIYNETTNTLMNAGFRGTFKYWLGDGTVKDSYNFTGEGQNHYLFCVDKNLSYLTDSEIAINATTNNRIYQFVKEIYSNSTKIQKLYIPDDAYTNTIIIEVKNQGLIPLSNITVNISRYYPGIDKYEVVEHKTTDEFGQIITKIIQYDVKYKFRFYNSAGVLLKESDKVTIICRTAYCVVPFIIETTTDYLGRYDNLTSFSYELSFDNTSNIFTYSWIDQTGKSAVHRLEVTRYQFNGSTIICNSTSTSTVSSLNCSIGSQSSTYTAQAFRKATGKNEIRTSYLQAIVGDYSQTFGIEGLFWVFILLMVGIGIGIYNPSVGALVYGTGFIFMGILKIIYMPLPVFFANTLLVIIFIWAVKT